MVVFRHVMEFMVNPLFLCLFLLGMITFFLWRGNYPVFMRWAMLFILSVLLLISTGWLPRFMTGKLESRYAVITQADPSVPWIVILSGGQSQVVGMPPNDLLSSASIKRLIEGVRLFRALPQAQLVFAGGKYEEKQAEAVLMAELAHWFSIPKQNIVLELTSINTADQARELVAIVHKQPFYLVTSAIHMPRAMALCRAQGLNPIAAPTDFTFYWTTGSWVKLMVPNAYNLSYFSIALHEVLGRLWAAM